MTRIMGAAKLIVAAEFAAEKHIGQFRKGNRQAPYINHPIEVARILADVGGVDDIDLLAAALLHDTMEHGDTTDREIRDRFGDRVADLVVEVTDDPLPTEPQRKQAQIEHAAELSVAAQQLKLADKISNIRDVSEHPPKRWTKQQLLNYIQWGIDVVAEIRGKNASLENCFDAAVKRAKRQIADFVRTVR